MRLCQERSCRFRCVNVDDNISFNAFTLRLLIVVLLALKHT